MVSADPQLDPWNMTTPPIQIGRAWADWVAPAVRGVMHAASVALSFVDTHSGALTLIATVAIAAFTFTLWRSTDKLWSAAERQRRDARHSIYASQVAARASRESAVAAKKTADATEKLLNNLEVPYVLPHEMKFNYSDSHGSIAFSFKNYGRSPATVSGVWVSFVITVANQPTAARFNGRKDFMFDEVIGEKEVSERLQFADDTLRQHGGHVANANEDLHLTIHFEWQGLIGPKRSAMQSFIWSPDRARFLSGFQLWDDPRRFAPRPGSPPQ